MNMKVKVFSFIRQNPRCGTADDVGIKVAFFPSGNIEDVAQQSPGLARPRAYPG
jgi:hypothetical protein